MPAEKMMPERLTELSQIVDQLVDIINTARKAFIHQRSQLLTQLNNQQDPLCREICSAMQDMFELAIGKAEGEREPYVRFHSILTHLQIIAETTCRLEETLQKQIKEGVLFSDKAIAQVSHLLDQQTDILSCLADVIRKGGKEARHHALEECKNLAQTCLQFATDHETRLVEGLCFPRAAPLFLAILDQMQTIVHHEKETVQLMGNKF